MPILRKNGEKVYFSHIPKTAGSSLYLWFMENGWQISNLGTTRGPLGVNGVGKKIRERYGIFHLQQEGDYSGVKTSPHHVTADIWGKWGPFDRSFAIVREPIERFRSALTFQYTSVLRHQNRQHSERLLENFRDQVLTRLENRLEAKPHLFDNHFRRQQEFVSDTTKIYYFDADWGKQIAKDFALTGSIGHEKKSDKHIELTEREETFARSYFAKDLDWYRSLR
jgi:hypothetical protein